MKCSPIGKVKPFFITEDNKPTRAAWAAMAILGAGAIVGAYFALRKPTLPAVTRPIQAGPEATIAQRMLSQGNGQFTPRQLNDLFTWEYPTWNSFSHEQKSFFYSWLEDTNSFSWEEWNRLFGHELPEVLTPAQETFFKSSEWHELGQDLIPEVNRLERLKELQEWAPADSWMWTQKEWQSWIDQVASHPTHPAFKHLYGNGPLWTGDLVIGPTGISEIPARLAEAQARMNEILGDLPTSWREIAYEEIATYARETQLESMCLAMQQLAYWPNVTLPAAAV